jgi:hypothetical protein
MEVCRALAGAPGAAKPPELLSTLIPVPGTFGFPQLQVRIAYLQDVRSILIPPMTEEVKLDAAERRRVTDAVIKNLKVHYIDPAIAEKMAEALLAYEKAGDDDAMTDGAAFAALLTRQLRDVSHDVHLEVLYSQTPLPGPTRRASRATGGLSRRTTARSKRFRSCHTISVI